MESPVEAELLAEGSESPVLEEISPYLTSIGSMAPELEGQHSDPSDPEPVHTTGYSEHDGSWQVEVAGENAAQENGSQGLESELDEDENKIFLDPDHELVKRFQTELSIHLNKELDRVNSALKEKLAQKKADEEEINATETDISRYRENLARLYYKIDDLHQTKAKTMEKYHHALDHLEASKTQFTKTKNELEDAKAATSQRQSELDTLTRNLAFTQEISRELHSNTKAIRNATHKAEAKKLQAGEEKQKQDRYVKHLTKELETLTEQVDLCNAQTAAQAEQTQAAKDALSEAEMQMASMQVYRQQILHQWNSSLAGMTRQAEAFTAMQEAKRLLEHQSLSLDREIQGYDKAIMKEQEQNDILTRQLKRAQMDNSTTKSLINQKKAQQEALQTEYSTTLRTLQETEHTLEQLNKEKSSLESDVKDLQRQQEKESTLRLELEDKIVFAMQQKLTHNHAAKAYQKQSDKLKALKKEKMTQLWQLENDIAAAKQERSEIEQNLDNMAFTQKTLDEELLKRDRQLSDQKAKMSSCMASVEQKQKIITELKKKIDKIEATTGREDLGPQQIKVEAMQAQIEELEANINRDHQLWIKGQGTLVGFTQELETTNRKILHLQEKHTCLEQEKMHTNSLIEGEQRELKDIQKNIQILRGDLSKMNTLLNKNKQLSQTLEQDYTLMQTDLTKKVQEEERECIKIQMKIEKTIEEKERLSKCLIEAGRQIMLWEKKIQILKETYATVQSVDEQAELQSMKAEIRRKEMHLAKLMKARERLLRESKATIARRETITRRRETMLHISPNKQKATQQLQQQGVQRRIAAKKQQVKENDQEIRELQEKKETMATRISQQKQLLKDLRENKLKLEEEVAVLQATSDINFSRLLVLQKRAKRLQSMLDNTYKPSSTPETVDAAIQHEEERLHSVSTIVQKVCQEHPQHQGALRKVSLALAAHAQDRAHEREASCKKKTQK